MLTAIIHTMREKSGSANFIRVHGIKSHPPILFHSLKETIFSIQKLTITTLLTNFATLKKTTVKINNDRL